MDNICKICKKRASNLCSGCRGPSYCSKQCLITDWKNGHKLTCARLPVEMNKCKIRYEDDDERLSNQSGFTVIDKELSDMFTDQKTLKINGSTFIQLFAYCESKNKEFSKIVIGSGVLHTTAILKRLKTNNYFVYKPKSTYISKLASKFGCKPIWLVGPDKHNKYLGLVAGTLYPIRKSTEYWAIVYTNNLNQAIKKSEELNILHKTGGFDADEMEISSITFSDISPEKS